MWFDEFYTEKFYNCDSVMESSEKADCYIIIGTTLTTGLPSSIL